MTRLFVLLALLLAVPAHAVEWRQETVGNCSIPVPTAWKAQSATPDPEGQTGQARFGTKESLLQVQWGPGGAALDATTMGALADSFANAGLLVLTDETRQVKQDPSMWQLSIRMGPTANDPPAAVLLWTDPTSARLYQVLIGTNERLVRLGAPAERAAAVDAMLERISCTPVAPPAKVWAVLDGVDPAWAAELDEATANLAYRPASELEMVMVRSVGVSAARQGTVATDAAARAFAATNGFAIGTVTVDETPPGAITRAVATLADAEGTVLSDVRVELWPCTEDLAALLIVQRGGLDWPWPTYGKPRCLEPDVLPKARAATVSAKAPPANPNGLLRPTFDTTEGPVVAGHASLVKVGKAHWLITAHHLFGTAGGMARDYAPAELPGLVKGAKASSPLPGGALLAAGTPQVFDGADSDPTRDLAALPVKKASGAPLAFADALPTPGSPVWLLADPVNGDPGAHLAWYAGTTDGMLLYYFHNADHDGQATSGAAVVDREGRLIGVNARGGDQDGSAYGLAVPLASVKAMLGAK